MLTESALMGIVCLLTQTSKMECQVQAEEQGQEEAIILAELHVPERLKEVLIVGREEVNRGEATSGNKAVEPTYRT